MNTGEALNAPAVVELLLVTAIEDEFHAGNGLVSPPFTKTNITEGVL